jgi:hypothetical protein
MKHSVWQSAWQDRGWEVKIKNRSWRNRLWDVMWIEVLTVLPIRFSIDEFPVVYRIHVSLFPVHRPVSQTDLRNIHSTPPLFSNIILSSSINFN